MIKLLIKLFIKDSQNTNDQKVRQHYGYLASITGIIVNLLLSFFKIIIGTLSGAISIISDGANNFLDANSSIVTLIGFKLASKKPDREHPFGHGRIEYVAGLIVSILIVFVGLEFLTSSINSITTGKTAVYENFNIAIISIIILVFSILTKIFLGRLNLIIGKKIQSIAIESTALDCFSDIACTTVVLISTIVNIFYPNIPIDGFAGSIVSIFIIITGIRAVLEIISVILGKAPDPKLTAKIAEFVKNYDNRILDIHDLMIHDYGALKMVVILHAEVPSTENLVNLHDLIDNIEWELNKKFNCISTIHLDPIDLDNHSANQLKSLALQIARSIDSSFTIHDFKCIPTALGTDLIFDLVITNDTQLKNDEIIKLFNDRLSLINPTFKAQFNIEYSYA